MPLRPCRSCSSPTQVSTSPARPGLRNSMLQPAATVALLRLLQAYAKVESASVKIRPPWQMAWPLSIVSRTVMRVTARPGSQLTSSICMKSRVARSAVNMTSPTRSASARSSISAPPSRLKEAEAPSGGSEQMRAWGHLFAFEIGRALFEKRHHAFDVVVRLAQGRLGIAFGVELRIEIARRRAAQQRAGRNQRLGRQRGQALRHLHRRLDAVLSFGSHVPDHPLLLRVFRAELVAQHRAAHGARQAQALDQEPVPAGVGYQPDLAEGLDERCAGCGDS